MQDFILIEGLKVETVIGCFNWERQILQPLLLDLKIWVDLSQACQSDQLEHTLNYAEICELAARTIIDTRPQLIEHAADLVVQALFERYAVVEKINITVRKPAIISAAQSVGIHIERHRDHLRHRHRD